MYFWTYISYIYFQRLHQPPKPQDRPLKTGLIMNQRHFKILCQVISFLYNTVNDKSHCMRKVRLDEIK